MARSAMSHVFRHARLQGICTAPLLLVAAANCGGLHAAPNRAAAWKLVPAQTPNAVSPLPVFELHSGFWVNLHHFLYLQARLSKGDAPSTESSRGAAQAELSVPLPDFPAAEITAWQGAVAIYAKDLAGRDLQLNGDMEIINNQLALMETCPDLEGKTSPSCKSGLRPDLVSALESAAPVYRAHWWAQQDRVNREWISQVGPLIQQMGVELSGQLADIYEHPWPAQRIRVDVAGYAGPYGAYTSLVPTHVTVSSRDPRNRGVYGFEVLFHEASHALAEGLNEAIAKEFNDRDKPIPRDLAHVLLFYTTGEMVRRNVEYGSTPLPGDKNGSPASYLPYAARFGLYSGSWERFRALLDLYWRPYLDGRVSFQTAIARLASEM